MNGWMDKWMDAKAVEMHMHCRNKLIRYRKMKEEETLVDEDKMKMKM